MKITVNRIPSGVYLCLLIAAAAGGCAQRETTAGSWSQWRGPNGTGATEEMGFPQRWSAGDGFRWAIDLPGSGISSPIVGHDVVYVTTGEGEAGEKALFLLALDLKTGETLWKTEVIKRPEEKLHNLNRAASATPATDGKTIFAYFGSHLGAVSAKGKLLWAREIYSEYLEYAQYGSGSSLVLTDDAVIVFRDRESRHATSGWLGAFSKDTGEEIWREEWQDRCCSYTTPLTINFANQPELLVAHAGRVISHDLRSGEQIWQRSLNAWQPVASPVVEDDLLCAASGAHSVREMGCWRLMFKNGKRHIEPLWKSEKAVPGIASPLLYGGLFFTIHEKGFTRCYNPETGQELWRVRLPPGGGYHASPVAGEGKIYAVNYAGTVSIFEAARQYRLLSESALPEGRVVASPALSDGCLIVRTGKRLYCIEGASQPAQTAS